ETAMAVATIEAQLIERVRRNYDAFNRCDFDAVIEMAHPDIVLVRAGGQGELSGAENVRAWMEPDAFASQVMEPVEFWVDGSKVLVQRRGSLRGAGSGIEMDVGAWTVWSFDERGDATRIEVFLEHEESLARNALLPSWASSSAPAAS